MRRPRIGTCFGETPPPRPASSDQRHQRMPVRPITTYDLRLRTPRTKTYAQLGVFNMCCRLAAGLREPSTPRLSLAKPPEPQKVDWGTPSTRHATNTYLKVGTHDHKYGIHGMEFLPLKRGVRTCWAHCVVLLRLRCGQFQQQLGTKPTALCQAVRVHIEKATSTEENNGHLQERKALTDTPGRVCRRSPMCVSVVARDPGPCPEFVNSPRNEGCPKPPPTPQAKSRKARRAPGTKPWICQHASQ